MTRRVFRYAVFASLCGLGSATYAAGTFALPQTYGGNFLGLAYRASDGHVFATQEAMTSNNEVGLLSMVYEFDQQGALVKQVNLHDAYPNVNAVAQILVPATGADLLVQTFTYDVATDGYSEQYKTLSGDFKTLSASGVPNPLATHDMQSSIEYTALSGTQLYGKDRFFVPESHVYVTSTDTGDVRAIDLTSYKDSPVGCYDGYLAAKQMCIQGVAPSWNGGFFVINEGSQYVDPVGWQDTYTEHLMEFDADGKLLHAMTLDHHAFDYHPMAMATDLVNHRVLVSFNNHMVATFSESEFLNGQLNDPVPTPPAVIPEPGTWALWLLGVMAMPLAARRSARRI